MKQIWLHIREQSSLDDRKQIQQAVRNLEACGLVTFEGDWREQSRTRSFEGRVVELPLRTLNPARVQDYLRDAVGDTCWIENQAAPF